MADLPLLSEVAPSNDPLESVTVESMKAMAHPQRFDGQVVLSSWAYPDDETDVSARPMARPINTGGGIACVHASFDALAHADQTDGRAHAMGAHVYRRWHDVESFRPLTTSEIDATTTTAGVA